MLFFFSMVMCDFSGEAAVYGSVIRRIYEEFRKFNPPLVATNPKKSKSCFFFEGGAGIISLLLIMLGVTTFES